MRVWVPQSAADRGPHLPSHWGLSSLGSVFPTIWHTTMQCACKCLQELVCKGKVLVSVSCFQFCQSLYILSASIPGGVSWCRRLWFSSTPAAPHMGLPQLPARVSKSSKVQPPPPTWSTTSTIFRIFGKVCFQKWGRSCLPDQLCCCTSCNWLCLPLLSSLPAEASQCHAVTEEAGSWYERWPRNGENVVINMVFSCIRSIPSCCLSPLCLPWPLSPALC